MHAQPNPHAQPQPMDPVERSGRQQQVVRRLTHLVDPFDEVSPRDAWDDRYGVWRPGAGVHVVSLPSLLDQLRNAVAVSGASSSTGTYESRVPVPTDAIDAEVRIGVEAATFVQRALVAASAGVDADLVLIRDRVPTLTDEDLLEVERLVRSWWASARILAQLEERPITPHMHCPLCDARDSIRVRLDRVADNLDLAWCRQCGEAWDEDTKGLLTAEIEDAMARAAEPNEDEDEEVDEPEPPRRLPRVDFVYLGGEGGARRWARAQGISPAVVYPAIRGLDGLWGRQMLPIVVEPADNEEYVYMDPELQAHVDAVDQHLTALGARRDTPTRPWV